MANCTSPGCGRTWDPPDGHFPLCFTTPCPLRDLQRATLSARSGGNVFQTIPNPQTVSGAVLVAPQVSQSLNWHRDSCSIAFQPYNMKGAQSATTTVTLRDGQAKVFRTTDQMHSEMCAIQWMMENGHWGLLAGFMVWISDGSAITHAQFSTTEPHCGFCTIFLLAARLPVGTPTCGNHKLASRLAYQLPYDLETNPHFMARVLDKGCYAGFPALKRVLNAFINVPAKQWVLSIKGLAYVDDVSYIDADCGLMVVDWYELVGMHKREVVYLAWKVIFEQIMLTNKSRQ